MSTTTNVESAPLLKNATATIMKMLDTTPDITFTRTGVPRRWLKTPNHGNQPPSADAIACTRSEPIIHTAPEVTSAPTKHTVIRSSRKFEAPP